MIIEREFAPADRYKYDWGLCSAKNGFAQVDTGQDAEYYGTWANPFKLIIFNYCEGDTTFQQAESKEEFVKTMIELKKWQDESGHGFKGIDCMCKENIEKEFIGLGLGDLLH